jgi:2-succinyl-5-enolpyruvyl-6-hydroxy-3-cyclohexene-1-carboxylate synthase
VSTPTDTHQLLRAFVDELARCGMRAACTSPGSRSTPLVLALAHEPRLACHSHIDERCAGFFALGLAKASGLPVTVACTSGTAAAELLPAAIEAHEAGVPLLLLTADRPPELRESGAGQTIDQVKLYGDAVKWFFEVGNHEATPARLRWMRTLACRAFARTLEGRPGAVHLNFPLREPLVSDEPLPADESGRPHGQPYVSRPPARLSTPEGIEMLGELVSTSRRGVVVAGRHERLTPLGEAAAAFCMAAGWPLLADPLSGARRGDAAVAHYDALLRDAAFADNARPDAVLRVGDLPTSKPLRGWLAGLRDVPQTILDPEGGWQDPDGALSWSLALDPAAALWQLSDSPPTADPDWLSGWRSADERAAEAILGVLAGTGANPGALGGAGARSGLLGGSGSGSESGAGANLGPPGAPGLSEPAIAAELGVLLPAEATLFVASSMPVRDIESFWPVRKDPPRVLCNRGANGIDGTVSSAFGVAAAGGGPVVLLIGDVALAYDIGGLLAHRRLGLDLTIVLLNNGGGGIFDFLPVARSQVAHRDEVYTTHIATPTGLDFAHAAELYGLGYELVDDVFAFRTALERCFEDGPGRAAGIVEVRTERAANVELHRHAWEAVAEALNTER